MIKSCKNLLLTLLIALSFTSLMKAQDKEKVETGKICFLRSTGLSGSGSAFKMFIDDKFVCKLNNKKFSIHEVAVGKHNCYVKGGRNKLKESDEKFEVKVEAGKTTYVQLIYEIGIFDYYLYFDEITEEIAKQKTSKMSEDTECL
nr:DUF2846 domain-containing protein [uncultured Flavobacterium sp.]